MKDPILKTLIHHSPFKTGLLVGQGIITKGDFFLAVNGLAPFTLYGWAVCLDILISKISPLDISKRSGVLNLEVQSADHQDQGFPRYYPPASPRTLGEPKGCFLASPQMDE